MIYESDTERLAGFQHEALYAALEVGNDASGKTDRRNAGLADRRGRMPVVAGQMHVLQ